jgi:hypothetical protein
MMPRYVLVLWVGPGDTGGRKPVAVTEAKDMRVAKKNFKKAGFETYEVRRVAEVK